MLTSMVNVAYLKYVINKGNSTFHISINTKCLFLLPHATYETIKYQCCPLCFSVTKANTGPFISCFYNFKNP